MGIAFWSNDTVGAYPRPLVLQLRCDRHTPNCEKFEGEFPNYVEAFSAAMQAGWLERHEDGRKFLCPACSGKKTMTAIDTNLPRFLDVRRLIWTYTMLSTYRDVCPHQADKRFVAKSIPFVQTPEMKWGADVHDAMELRVTARKPLPEPMQHWEPFAAAYDGLGALAEPKLAVDADWYPCEYFDKTGKIRGRGRADVLIIQGDTAYLGDWKTGGSKYESPFELQVQAALVQAKHPQIKTIKGQYIWLKEMRAGTLYDVSDTEATMDEVDRLVAQIEHDRAADHFEKKPGGLCGWCDVKDCEHWRPRKK